MVLGGKQTSVLGGELPAQPSNAVTVEELERELRAAKKDRAAWKREARYWRSLTHVSLGGNRV